MKRLLILAIFVLPASILSAQIYKVNSKTSTVEWVGKKISRKHNGTVGLKEGNFEIKDGRFINGSFTIDMDVMTDESHLDPKKPGKLISHLKSDDFFNVDKFPYVKLVITNSEAFKDGKAKVTGDLTIKDITHPITFVVTRTGAKFESSMSFDRTLYDIRYGSGKFFQDIGDRAILDDIEIDVSLIAERQR